jgi:hypothetical protein
MRDSNAQDGGDETVGPDFEVWNHLESGWQMAYDDLALKLSPEMLAFFLGMAKVIVGARSSLLVDPRDPALAKQIASVFPSVSPNDHGALFAGLMKVFAARGDPWLTHAVELELAGEGISRATSALERYQLVAPQLGQAIPDRALPYVREALSCFLFCFDAATIALCRSTVEQVAKEALIRLGVYTRRQIQRSRPPLSLETLIEKLKQAGALERSYEAAKRVKDRGNTILHDHLYDEKIRRQLALDSVADLADILRELLPQRCLRLDHSHAVTRCS